MPRSGGGAYALLGIERISPRGIVRGWGDPGRDPRPRRRLTISSHPPDRYASQASGHCAASGRSAPKGRVPSWSRADQGALAERFGSDAVDGVPRLARDAVSAYDLLGRAVVFLPPAVCVAIVIGGRRGAGSEQPRPQPV